MKSKENFERQQACGPCLQSPPSLKQNRFCLRAEGGAPVHSRGYRELWCCGVAYFFMRKVAVNKIPSCGVALILNRTVCGVSVFKPTVFGETK